MMIYGIIAAILAGLAALATIDIQHKNNVRLKNDVQTANKNTEVAVAANKSLSGSIAGVKKDCDNAVEAIKKQTTIDKGNQAKARATIAARAAIKDIKIEPLEASLARPAAGTKIEQCDAAEAILRDLAKDRTP